MSNAENKTETNNKQDKPEITPVVDKTPSKWAGRAKTTGKWLGIGVLCAGAGALGFLGLKHYLESAE